LRWANYPTPDYCVVRLSLASSWENLGYVSVLNFVMKSLPKIRVLQKGEKSARGFPNHLKVGKPQY